MRLFFAIPFSPEIRRVLLDAQDALRRQVHSANFTRPENLHLTLAFLGETPRLREAARIAAGISAGPFPLTAGGTGRFGELWWVGVLPNPALEALASELRNALRNDGFPVEDRPFQPHITLARQVSFDTMPKLTVPDASMTVRRVSLMKSERIGGKLLYTEVAGKLL